jgi:hypothetical protein
MTHALDRGETDSRYLPQVYGMAPVRVPFFPTHRRQTQSWTTARICSQESGTVFRPPEGGPDTHLVLLSVDCPVHRWDEVVRISVHAADAVTGAPVDLEGLTSTASVLVRCDRLYAREVPGAGRP